MDNPKPKKTLKREVAALLLAVLLLLIFLWVFFENLLAGEAVKVLNLPILTFAGAAFGLDSVVKQWNISNK
jgi:preprotein translocase subunit SecF